MFLILIPKSSLFLIFSCVVFPSHFGWQLLHSCFSPFISTRQVELICLCVFKSIVLVFVEILHFDFYLVYSECHLYLSIDHSLVYSYPKNFRNSVINFSQLEILFFHFWFILGNRIYLPQCFSVVVACEKLFSSATVC